MPSFPTRRSSDLLASATDLAPAPIADPGFAMGVDDAEPALPLLNAADILGRLDAAPADAELEVAAEHEHEHVQEHDHEPLAFEPEDRKSTRSELQSLMRNSFAVFCLKKKT